MFWFRAAKLVVFLILSVFGFYKYGADGELGMEVGVTRGHVMPSPFKVTTRYHSYTIRTGRSEVATTRSYIVDDSNLQGWS